mmetsp:Transcript_40801/g.65521  ORF Transcript_40801/g.65521 Transcript_40801/m.65521 type:complete len:167 (-) Transcript_40801:46-546(-)
MKSVEAQHQMEEIHHARRTMTMKQTKLLFVITRCVILSAFALITTLSFGLYAFYYRSERVNIYVLYVLWFLDMMINCICLYMNFVFADKLYKKGCKPCHLGCQAMLGWCTARKIVNSTRADLQLAAVMEAETKSVEMSKQRSVQSQFTGDLSKQQSVPEAEASNIR